MNSAFSFCTSDFVSEMEVTWEEGKNGLGTVDSEKNWGILVKREKMRMFTYIRCERPDCGFITQNLIGSGLIALEL